MLGGCGSRYRAVDVRAFSGEVQRAHRLPAVRHEAGLACWYLEELNRRLRMHRDYRPGMRVVSRRDGRGFDWEPNGYLHPFVEVSREVRKQFVIVEGRL